MYGIKYVLEKKFVCDISEKKCLFLIKENFFYVLCFLCYTELCDMSYVILCRNIIC